MRRVSWRPGLFAGFLAVLLLGAACNDDPASPGDHRYTAQESFRYSFDPSGLTGLGVVAISGSITVSESASADSIVVSGERLVRAGSQGEADDHLDDLAVVTEVARGRLQVSTSQPDQPEGIEYEVTYSVEMPDTLMALLRQVNGAVLVVDAGALVSTQVTNGDIELRDARARVSAQSVNGQIHGTVASPPGEPMACGLAVVNGAIDLRIPVSTDAVLYASAVNGTISVAGLLLSDLQTTPSSTTGTLGNGNGVVQLSTVNGGIQLSGY